jgi:hypothetical protein
LRYGSTLVTMQSLRQLSSRKGLLSTQFLMSFGSSLWQNTVAQQGPLRPPTCQWEQLLQAATQKDVGTVPRGSPCAGRSPLASRGRGSDKHKHLNTHAHPSDQPPPLAGAGCGDGGGRTLPSPPPMCCLVVAVWTLLNCCYVKKGKACLCLISDVFKFPIAIVLCLMISDLHVYQTRPQGRKK